MPASAAITNGSLVSDTSPSSMLIGSSCACAEGVATVAMAARTSALVKWFCMIDLPSTNDPAPVTYGHHIDAPPSIESKSHPQVRTLSTTFAAYERHTVIKPA